MAMHNVRYVVVERAGYVGEKDVKAFDTISAAWSYVECSYSALDRDPNQPDAALPDVRTDWLDDEGNEQSEYIY